MCMNGHEIKKCCECDYSDYESFMVEREDYWYCKDCDPGAEHNKPDPVDFQMSREDR